jgi:polyhydroxyalkanoate synthesis regulator phasin
MNDMTIYNIKNAELQHMVYETGLSVMEKIAESTMHKIENGEEVNSMMKLYQDYLSTSDKMFVDLFETDEYSKLMSEVSVMKMQIKKAVETQMEKAFVNMPIATRSEMDEVYQTIYDLKKMVRSLESKLHNMPAEKSHKAATHTEETAAPKATAAAPKVTKPATAKPAAAKPATKKTAKRK